MPIYEYQCQACDQKQEALQKMADAPLVDCKHCGEAALKKLVSAAAFKLKGSGWYETDFKNSGKKPAQDSAAKNPAEKSVPAKKKTSEGGSASSSSASAS